MNHLRVCYTTRKASNGQLKLFLRVIFNGWMRDSSMHRKTDAYKWDPKRQRVKEVTEDDKTLNDLLESNRVSVYGHYNIMLTERKLLQVFREHNDRMKSLLPSSDYAEGTYKKYTYAYNKVKDFIKFAYNEPD